MLKKSYQCQTATVFHVFFMNLGVQKDLKYILYLIILSQTISKIIHFNICILALSHSTIFRDCCTIRAKWNKKNEESAKEERWGKDPRKLLACATMEATGVPQQCGIMEAKDMSTVEHGMPSRMSQWAWNMLSYDQYNHWKTLLTCLKTVSLVFWSFALDLAFWSSSILDHVMLSVT